MTINIAMFITEVDQLFSHINEMLEASSHVSNADFLVLSTNLHSSFLYHKWLWQQSLNIGDEKKVLVCGCAAAHELANKVTHLSLFCQRQKTIDDHECPKACVVITQLVKNTDKLLFKIILSMRERPWEESGLF